MRITKKNVRRFFRIKYNAYICSVKIKNKAEKGDKKSPSLLQKILITKEHILSLANAHLNGGNVYITNIKVAADNHISLSIDGDNGVSIDDCVALSRAIESKLDRDKEDFYLDVSSHGATTPLLLPRQYTRHIGRTFEVKLLDGEKAEGELIRCDAEKITLQYSLREPKPLGKGKVTVVKEQTIPFSQIKEARIKLKY